MLPLRIEESAACARLGCFPCRHLGGQQGFAQLLGERWPAREDGSGTVPGEKSLARRGPIVSHWEREVGGIDRLNRKRM